MHPPQNGSSTSLRVPRTRNLISAPFRLAINQRQAQERADLQAKHERELQAAAPAQRADVEQRHQDERKAMQDRHNEEQKAVQQRHADERKKQGGK